MLKAFLILFLLIQYAAAGSYFLKSCNAKLQEGMISEQLKWLKIIFRTNDCTLINDKLNSLSTLNDIIPNRSVQSLRSRQSFMKPSQLRAPDISFSQYQNDWIKAERQFSNLELFKDFQFEHIYYENDPSSPRGICEIISELPTIESISIFARELKKKDIECIQNNKINVYVMGPLSNFEPLKEIADRITGIDDYRIDLETLHHFINLKFLQIKFHDGNLNLRELAKAKNLSGLILNLSNLKDIKPITSLRQIRNLSLTCHKEMGSNSRTAKCEEGSLKDVQLISNLPFLESLDLSWNDIEDLTPLQKLRNLKFLDVRMNNLKSVPQSLLKNLRHLNVAKNKIDNIEGLAQNNELEYLNISNNNIQTLMPLKNLRTLKYLALGGNSSITDLSFLKNSEQLVVLNLDPRFPRRTRQSSENEPRLAIELISQNGDDFQNINEILFQDSELIDSLEKTNNRNSEFITLPKLPNLKVLIASGLNLQNIQGFAKTNIQFLDISNSVTTSMEKYELPRGLVYFEARDTELAKLISESKQEAIKFLDLGNNQNIPIESFNFPNLQLLKLDNNSLKDVPDVSNFPKLRTLQLQHNNLKSFEIKYAKELTYIDLSNNHFSQIPKFENAKKLETVFLYENKIQSLLGVLRNDVDFFLDKNPIIPGEDNCPVTSKNKSIREFCTSR